MKVYLDYAATTPIKKEVSEAMLPYLKENFGNPSSIHSFGRQARSAVDDARLQIANFLNCQTDEIIFTSGATESINLALLGFVANFSQEKIHIISTMSEHHAVLETLHYIEKQGWASVTYLRPNRDGLINVEDLKRAINNKTRLVSVMYVNNEIGTIQPIREIGKLIEKENEKRKSAAGSRIFFHTDAVQGIGYLESNVNYLHVDMLSFSGHKIYAPKGIGVLYVRKGMPLRPRIHGGGQEFGLRPGTENVAGIVGLAKAVELIQKTKGKTQKQIEKLRNYFVEKIIKEIPEIEQNGSKSQMAPHIANLYFKYIEGESIVLALDLEGVACSTGSACTSQSLTPSHVIMACYDDSLRAAGSVRFSFGSMTTKKELDCAIGKIKEIVTRLREISPYAKEKNEYR